MVQIDGAPWFVAADVGKALGLSQPAQSKAVRNMKIGNVSNYRVPGTMGRPNKIITEAGTYELVFQSRKPDAMAFRDWVTGTVLPSIRKDGGYIKGEEKVAIGEMSEDELVLKAMDGVSEYSVADF
ncbi:Bro-N domain-containing protein [Rhodobacter lacus]|uniref:Bro-N domain-containing protein n=1 Tax=Rhodobacter lacus TaxID=1641972 RepID=A0ABW5A9H5_9RHOB